MLPKNMSVSEEKTRLRERVLKKRSLMTEEELTSLSALVQSALLASQEFEAAGTLAIYSGTRGEVMTDLIFEEARKLGKSVCYPRVMGESEELVFFSVEKREELIKGTFGILEPSGTDKNGESVREVTPVSIDLFVIPGVAFDKNGGRLGFGAGYYDKVLSGVDTLVIGLCFEFQLEEKVPTEAHDVPVDVIITESRLIRH